MQYQCIFPLEKSFDGLQKLFNAVTKSQHNAFMAVLKLHGKSNDNFLSFPKEGYSLALDFKIKKGLFKWFNKLDKIVVEYGGRIYLAKDVRVSKTVFEKGYPQIEAFRALRKEYQMDKKFHSLQSKRVEI